MKLGISSSFKNITISDSTNDLDTLPVTGSSINILDFNNKTIEYYDAATDSIKTYNVSTSNDFINVFGIGGLNIDIASENLKPEYKLGVIPAQEFVDYGSFIDDTERTFASFINRLYIPQNSINQGDYINIVRQANTFKILFEVKLTQPVDLYCFTPVLRVKPADLNRNTQRLFLEKLHVEKQ